MKKITTVLLSLWFCASFAQTWSITSQSEDTLNFKSSANYVFSLVADSVYNGGTYQIIYPESALDIDSFYMPDLGKVNGESWLGSAVIENENEIIFLYKSDSLILPLKNASTTCLVKGEQMTIYKDSIAYQMLPIVNVQDSVMYFHIETNSTSLVGSCLNKSLVALSRQNGLIAFPACFTNLHEAFIAPITIGGLSRTDFTFFSTQEIFDYSIGDKMHYLNTTNPFGSGDKLYVSRNYIGKQIDSVHSSTTYSVFDTTYFYTFHTGPNNPPREINLKNSYNMEYFYDQKALTSGISLQPYEFTDHLEFIQDELWWCYDLGEKTWMSDMASVGFPGKRGIRLFSEFIKTGNYVQKSSYGQTCTWSSEAYFVEGIGLVKSRVFDGTIDLTMVLAYAKINGLTVYGNEIPYFNIPENQLSTLTIFPNPAKNVLHIKGLKTDKKCTWEIFDLSGRKLKSGRLEGANDIQIDALKSGAYILMLENIKAIRFVKM